MGNSNSIGQHNSELSSNGAGVAPISLSLKDVQAAASVSLFTLALPTAQTVGPKSIISPHKVQTFRPGRTIGVIKMLNNDHSSFNNTNTKRYSKEAIADSVLRNHISSSQPKQMSSQEYSLYVQQISQKQQINENSRISSSALKSQMTTPSSSQPSYLQSLQNSYKFQNTQSVSPLDESVSANNSRDEFTVETFWSQSDEKHLISEHMESEMEQQGEAQLVKNYLNFIEAQFILHNEQLVEAVADKLISNHGQQTSQSFRQALQMAVKSKLEKQTFVWSTVQQAEQDLQAKEFTDLFNRVKKYQNGPVTSRDELSSPKPQYDFNACLRDKQTFSEFRNQLLLNTKEWKGKGEYLNDERKEKFFDKNMFLYACDQFLGKKRTDYMLEAQNLQKQEDFLKEHVKSLSEQGIVGQELQAASQLTQIPAQQEWIREIQRQDMCLVKMLAVKKQQNEAEQIPDPVITDALDNHIDPEITKLQQQVIQQRQEDLIAEKTSKKKYLLEMKKITLLKYLDKKVQKSGGEMSINDKLLQSMLLKEDPYLTGKHILQVKKELAFEALCAKHMDNIQDLDQDSKFNLDSLVQKIELEQSEDDGDIESYFQNVISQFKEKYLMKQSETIKV